MTKKDLLRIAIIMKSSPEMAVSEMFAIMQKEMHEALFQQKVDMVLEVKRQFAGYATDVAKMVREQTIAEVKNLPFVKGMKGDTGWSPTPKDLQKMTGDVYTTVMNRLPPPKEGKPGEKPIAGIDYPSKSQIKEMLQEEARKYQISSFDLPQTVQEKITNIVTDKISGKDIVSLINALSTIPEFQIDASHIKNLSKGKVKFGGAHGSGVPSLSAGTNITLTAKSDGGFTVASTGGASATIYTESLATQTIDGTNTTYTTLNTITAVLSLIIDRTSFHPIADFTTSGTTITMKEAIPLELKGAPFTVIYT